VTDEYTNRNQLPQSTSTCLLKRVKRQSQAAWERLASLYAPLVYHWCRKAGLEPNQAAEVGQEVFRAVARKIAEFHRDREGDTFRRWLRTITQGKIREHAMGSLEDVPGAEQSDSRVQLQDASDAEPEAEDPAAIAEEVRLLYRRAAELIRMEFDDLAWQAFWRVAVERQKPEEAAGALGIAECAVYLAKSRIRRRLRQEFAELMEV
jgi:RNA polymerase sigma-70 factor, ECF subfamily